ncbi:MAG: NFACT RNA binding domain-containing protein [Nanoarchaeota archaeon]|mgnify:CR=1 FL=1
MEEPKFRNITLASGATILLGKNAEQNEILMNQFKGKEDIILHTAEPGSPFCVINKGSHSKKDISEAAVFCAAYSRDWRDNKKDVVVHIFNGKDIYKRKGMEKGTFGVKKFKVIKVKKEEIEKCQK